MKKLVLFAAVVFGLSTMNAQKNSILLGGNVGYTHTENKFAGSKDKLDSYTWAPYAGYQFSEHLTLGAVVNFTKADYTDGTEGSLKTQKIGGFLRYTQPFSETFSIYADLGAGWMKETNKTYAFDPVTGNRSDVRANREGYYIGFTPALFINFKNNFGLNFSIGGVEYNHMKANGVKPSDTKDNVKVTFGNAFNIGISKNFSL